MEDKHTMLIKRGDTPPRAGNRRVEGGLRFAEPLAGLSHAPDPSSVNAIAVDTLGRMLDDNLDRVVSLKSLLQPLPRDVE
jgi:hypothetical protein